MNIINQSYLWTYRLQVLACQTEAACTYEGRAGNLTLLQRRYMFRPEQYNARQYYAVLCAEGYTGNQCGVCSQGYGLSRSGACNK